MLAGGRVDPTPLVTGAVGLDGVAGGFEALGDPERHAKILIDPTSSVIDPTSSAIDPTSSAIDLTSSATAA
jgi:hypothetical protein